VETVMRRLDLLGYLGLLLVAAAALTRLLVAGSGPAALGLAALGVAVFLVYFFRAGHDVQRFLSRRSTHEGGNVLGTAIFVVAIAVLVNILASHFRVQTDVTADKLFTMAPETITALHSAPSAPEILAFYPEGDPTLAGVAALADAARMVDPAIVFRAVDPDREPGEALRFDVREPTTVVRVGERHETFSGAREADFLGALLRASRPGKRARIAFLRGHGEPTFNDASPRGARSAAEALYSRGYVVVALGLLDGRSLRDSVDVLVVAGPQVPFAPAEEESLRVFLDGGGRLLALLDPAWPVTIDSTLTRYGARFVPRFLADPSGREPQVLLPGEYSAHPAVAALRRRNVPVVFRGVGEIVQSRPSVSGARHAALIRSSEHAVIADDPGSEPSARILAAAAEWPASPRPGRLIVVGDVDFATQELFGVLGDADFLLGCVQWLADEEASIQLRPRERTSRPVLLTRQQGRALMVLLVGALPFGMLVVGAAAWWRRR
jgi:ABC-type uncharacterized transport system involved in gliding motility auxiliary subunit